MDNEGRGVSAAEPSYAGLFESHVSVEARDVQTLERFRETCAEVGVKCLLIELSRGVTRSQPMANSFHHGTFQQARSEAMDLAKFLAGRGFPVLRVKIEAAPDNCDIPETDEHTKSLAPENYFEFHAKLILPGEGTIASVRAVCEPHGAHLSANVFKRLDEGKVERFVTLRQYGVGRDTADARLAELLRSLDGIGCSPMKVVREYCVFDSNLSLDDGWLEP
jgi:hypothetical protein